MYIPHLSSQSGPRIGEATWCLFVAKVRLTKGVMDLAESPPANDTSVILTLRETVDTGDKSVGGDDTFTCFRVAFSWAIKQPRVEKNLDFLRPHPAHRMAHNSSGGC